MFPFLFNFYINDLLEECIKANIGAKLEPFNVSIICYCDDITLISSSIHDMNRLLRICGDYAKDWKLEFSINKCNWTCFGKEVFNDAKFTLQNQELCYSENVIHLGLPIGSREFVNNHLKGKFKKVERSFYSLYGLG